MNKGAVWHVFDAQGLALCGHQPSKQVPDRWSPLCSVCRRSRAFYQALQANQEHIPEHLLKTYGT
jgi:hypothetical protein